MLFCIKEKGKGALLFSGEGTWCSTVLSRRKLLFSGEGNMCSIVLWRRENVHYCYQEKETDALLFHEKGYRALLFLGEGNWCSTAHVCRRRGMLLYCSREKGDGAVLIGFYLYQTLIFICLS